VWFLGWIFKLPGLLKTFGEFLARTWKLWAVVILLGVVFFAGRWYEEGKWLEKEVGELQALRDARDERERLLRAQHDDQLAADALVRASLANDLEALRQRESELRDELEFAELELVKPLNIVKIPGQLNDCEKPVLANPFGPDFIRLFNEYGRLGSDAGADSETETD
jgi:Sec-independent protein translocase protein TatA